MLYGLNKDETIRSVASKSKAHFVMILIIASLPAFLDGFDVNVFQFGSPYIVRNVGVSTFMLGVLTSGYTAGIALFSLVGGVLFDKFSVKYTIILSTVIFSIFTVVSGFTTNIVILVIARLLVGVGIGMLQPAVLALLGDIFVKSRGLGVSVFTIFFGLGSFAGPYIISPFLPDYKFPFILSGALSLIVIIIFYLIIPKQLDTVKKGEAINNEVNTSNNSKGLLNSNVVFLSAAILFFGIALAGYYGYYSEYLLNYLNLSNNFSAAIMSMAGLGTLVCAIPLGILADKIGRKHGVTITALIIFMGTIGMFALGGSSAILFIATFLFGAGWGMFIALTPALAQDSVPPAVSGTVVGIIFALFNIGAVFGGLIVGGLIPLGFITAVLLGISLPALLSFILTFSTKKV